MDFKAGETLRNMVRTGAKRGLVAFAVRGLIPGRMAETLIRMWGLADA